MTLPCSRRCGPRVDGIVMKDDAAQVLQEAIAKVTRGERHIALELMDRAFALATAEPAPNPLATLSDREPPRLPRAPPPGCAIGRSPISSVSRKAP